MICINSIRVLNAQKRMSEASRHELAAIPIHNRALSRLPQT